MQLINGIDIQYLDGIDIQLLDGTSIQYSRPMDAQQLAALRRINEHAKKEETARRHAIQALTYGINNELAYQAEKVAEGGDFSGFSGDGSVEDEEMIRSYLVHTKEVADASPVMVSGYQNAQNLSNMIGYVLKHWDSSAREQAIDNMIAEESRLQGLGAINDVDNARSELSRESYTDIDVYMYGLGSAKNSFFKAVKRSLQPTLTTEAQDVVAANPATLRLRNSMRHAARKARNTQGKATSENTATAINGVDDDAQMLLSGEDLQYAISGEDPLTSISRYMQRTRRLAVNHPEYFESAAQANNTIVCVDALMRVWNNEPLRNRIFTQIDGELDGELGKLFKKIKKALKKAAKAVGNGVKKAAKTVAKGVKTAAKAVAKAAKKVGKAIAKVAKKAWKFIVRFNPLTLLIRAGILGFVRLNMFKVANKCYIGSMSKADALKKGATADEWEKSNKAYKHLANAYTKLGGKESKLKKTLEKGNKKKWTGTEYPTDGNTVKTAANSISAANNKEAQADMDYDETLKEYNSKGYISDKTVSTDTATVEKKEEVTIIENERTAKNATKMYETDETSGKVLVIIPKAAKVLVDTAQKSGNFIAATYNGKNGWVASGDLAGLGECDAESCAVLMAGAVYDMGFDGLGEPATATAVASASSVIASIMAKIKSIFGVAQKAATAVKTAVNNAKAVKNTVNTVKNVATKAKKVVDTAKKVSNTAKTVANTVKNNVNKATTALKVNATNLKNVAVVAAATPKAATTAAKSAKATTTKTPVTTKATTPTKAAVATQTKQATTQTTAAKTATNSTSKGRTQSSAFPKQTTEQKTTKAQTQQTKRQTVKAQQSTKQQTKQTQPQQEQYASMVRQPQSQEEQPKSSSKKALIIGGALILAAGGAFLLMRKRK